MNMGIYQIGFSSSEKKYIGSATDIKRRKRVHLSYLSNAKHPNSHLQSAYNKYGEGAFEFKVLLYCDPENCILYEQMAIDAFSPERLYNIRMEAKSNIGLPAWNKGKTGLQTAWNKGKKMSAEEKKNMSKSHKGYKWTDETREKMMVILQNRSPETRKKLSIATTNYWKKRKAGV